MVEESEVLPWLATIMIVLAVPTFIALVFFKRAPYGRYISEGKGYGFEMNGKLAWVLQESPCPIFAVLNFFLASDNCLHSLPNMILLGLYALHYFHRTFIFPFKLRGGKPTPFFVFMGALVFCLINGYMQTAWVTRVYVYPESWVTEPRFLIGVILFFVGMAINIHADYTLINLRKPGESGYKVPKGGAFKWVSGANYFGEIVEWTGFAIAGWSYVSLAFAIFTFSNIAPRGAQHHKYYLEKMKDTYPKDRKAVIPFIW